MWSRLPKTAEIPQLQFIKGVDFSFVVPRPIPMVLATIETPQFRSCRFPGVVQRQIPMVQTLLDHRVSPVAPQGDRCPCLQVVLVFLTPVDAQRRLPTVQTDVGPKRFPSSLTQ